MGRWAVNVKERAMTRKLRTGDEQPRLTITGVDFSDALDEIKAGRRMRRAGWNGKGMFVFLVQGSRFVVNRPPLLGIYPEGTEITYRSHIDMCDAEGKVVPWLASQTDLLAHDWELAE
jgi:hypothetical protein